MASTGLNFSNLTPDNGAIKDLKRLIFLAVTDPESLGKIFNFLPKQKHGEKVGFIGEFGMVGKASQGCNPTFGTSVLATSEKEWDIREWEVAEKICYKDLEGTVAQVAMRTKTNIADLTGTEYTDYILAPRLELAIRKMLMRYAWFGDKAADTVTDGGNLLDSIDPAYFYPRRRFLEASVYAGRRNARPSHHMRSQRRRDVRRAESRHASELCCRRFPRRTYLRRLDGSAAGQRPAHLHHASAERRAGR